MVAARPRRETPLTALSRPRSHAADTRYWLIASCALPTPSGLTSCPDRLAYRRTKYFRPTSASTRACHECAEAHSSPLSLDIANRCLVKSAPGITSTACATRQRHSLAVIATHRDRAVPVPCTATRRAPRAGEQGTFETVIAPRLERVGIDSAAAARRASSACLQFPVRAPFRARTPPKIERTAGLPRRTVTERVSVP